MAAARNDRWWESAVVYQVYPRSYQDSNDDGVGDIPGITSRLQYIRDLGATAIWISPIYPSPMVDFGYDVSCYTDVEPLFGNLAQFDQLLAVAHSLGLRVILDFVPNHTSNLHPWFLDSRSSRSSPKRDWYIWKDPNPVTGGPPNNWVPHFGGTTAWEFDDLTGQYYLHLFTKEQPDLNWDNPEVESAMLNSMEFWLRRGVDGFRVDVICLLAKDKMFRDDPPNPEWNSSMPWGSSILRVFSEDQPRVHDIISRMRTLVDRYHSVLIGEVWYEYPRLVKYYGDDNECHLPFNFGLIRTEFSAAAIAEKVCSYEKELRSTLNGWPNWVLGNHDVSRVATRIGAEKVAIAQMLLLTLRGTPTLYYGDEIGMHDVCIPPEKTQDPMAKAKTLGSEVSRDPERTPMQHNASAFAGFSNVEPWLPVATDYTKNNVEAELRDPQSILTLVKHLLSLRAGKDSAAKLLCSGDYQHLLPDTPTTPSTAPHPCLDPGSILAFKRALPPSMASGTPPSGTPTEHGSLPAIISVLNFGAISQTVDTGLDGTAVAIASTLMDHSSLKPVDLHSVTLRPFEGLVLHLA
ncbi:alpha amylase, catalytic region [Pelomyxa schiedti]|nr:alpha amylase, catalytic region [Pelomyxa schiedti]